MEIEELSKEDCFAQWSVPKIFTSPLLTTLALTAIAMAVLPFTVGAAAL